MSIIVEYQGRTVWEPATAVGMLFIDHLQAIGRMLGCDTGIKEIMGDTYDVDAEQLSQFLNQLEDRLERSDDRMRELCGACFTMTKDLEGRIRRSPPQISVAIGSQ